MLTGLKARSEAELEALHRELLEQRDRLHNRLRGLTRDLDAVRAERMDRARTTNAQAS